VQTGLTGHSRLIRDNWVTHVLREWLVGVDHSTVRKSQIQRCQKCPPTEPTINERITSLRNVRICQYYCYGPEIRIQGRLCTHTWNNATAIGVLYVRPERIWIILSIYTDSGTRWNTGWCAEYLDSKTHVFNRVTGEQTRTRDCVTLFPQMGLFWHVFGTWIIARHESTVGSLSFWTGWKKSLR
jgi:hypothetical protein